MKRKKGKKKERKEDLTQIYEKGKKAFLNKEGNIIIPKKMSHSAMEIFVAGYIEKNEI